MARNGVLLLILGALAIAVAGDGTAGSSTSQEILFVGPVRGSSYTILTIREDGGDVRELLRAGNAGRLPTRPRWSPDGHRLVYNGPEGLMVSPASGGEGTRITKGLDVPLEWSPNRRWIAFSRVIRRAYWLFVVEPTGRSPRKLTALAQEGEATWAPDSKRLLAETKRGIQIVDLRGNRRPLPHASCGEDPAWSPDGRWIAFARCIRRPSHLGIAIERPDGSGLRWLTRPRGPSPVGDWRPAWSPDSTKLAYTHSRPVRNLDHSEIRVVGRDGRNLGNMDSYAEDHDDRAAWSPHGTKLVFDRDAAIEPVGEGVRLAVADARTGRTRVIYDQPFRGSQSWRPRIREPARSPAVPVHRWTKAEIQSRTRAAVRRSRAEIVRFAVVMPNHRYTLVLQVHDPAAFLEYRAGRTVDTMNRLTNVSPRFRLREFGVRNSAGQVVLRVVANRKRVRVAPGQWKEGSTTWYVAPRLEECAENLDLDVEINPEGSAPRCPA